MKASETLKAIVAKYNSISLMIRIVIGLIVGSILGLTVPGIFAISLFGDLFVGALKAIAPILVFVLVTSALSQGSEKLDSRFGLVIWLYLLRPSWQQLWLYAAVSCSRRP